MCPYKNLEMRRAYYRNYHWEHRASKNATKRMLHWLNRDRDNQRSCEYHELNRKKLNAKMKEYRVANIVKVLEIDRKRGREFRVLLGQCYTKFNKFRFRSSRHGFSNPHLCLENWKNGKVWTARHANGRFISMKRVS